MKNLRKKIYLGVYEQVYKQVHLRIHLNVYQKSYGKIKGLVHMPPRWRIDTEVFNFILIAINKEVIKRSYMDKLIRKFINIFNRK